MHYTHEAYDNNIIKCIARFVLCTVIIALDLLIFPVSFFFKYVCSSLSTVDSRLNV